MKITIVYDNNPWGKGLTTAWGFGCVVRYEGKTILFDTGGDGAILLSNMRSLQIDPREIDTVVLSHIHGDHVGGLSAFLSRNHDVTVVAPASFPQRFKREIEQTGARLVEVRAAQRLGEHIFTTGQLDGGIPEQSLVLQTKAGLVVITGCAHPGIVRIIEHVKRSHKGDVALVLGGFHLGGARDRELRAIVDRFQQLGVRCAAPCHCSGDRARALFEQAYGDRYLGVGVGSQIDLAALQPGPPAHP